VNLPEGSLLKPRPATQMRVYGLLDSPSLATGLVRQPTWLAPSVAGDRGTGLLADDPPSQRPAWLRPRQ
jgi:hypothetical protein